MMIWNQSKSYCALDIVVWNEVFTYFPVLYSTLIPLNDMLLLHVPLNARPAEYDTLPRNSCENDRSFCSTRLQSGWYWLQLLFLVELQCVLPRALFAQLCDW